MMQSQFEEWIAPRFPNNGCGQTANGRKAQVFATHPNPDKKSPD